MNSSCSRSPSNGSFFLVLEDEDDIYFFVELVGLPNLGIWHSAFALPEC